MNTLTKLFSLFSPPGISIMLLGRIWLFGLIIYIPLFLSGQQDAYVINRISASDNLTSPKYNYYIFKDSEGFVWISSTQGLNRFDGRSIKQYLPDPGDPTALEDANIQSNFFEDHQQNLWFSTERAITCYLRKEDNFKKYNIIENGAPVKTGNYLLYFDTLESNLWVRVNSQLYSCHYTGDSLIQNALGTVKEDIRIKIQKAKDINDIFLYEPLSKGLKIRLFRNNTEIKEFGYPKTLLPGQPVSRMYFERTTNLWASNTAGLVNIDLNSNNVREIDNPGGFQLNDIKGIAAFNSDKLIVATENKGVFFFDRLNESITGRLFRFKEEGNEPFLNLIDRIYVDDDLNLWISTQGSGVYFTNLSKKKFNHLFQNSSHNPQESNFVRAMAEDYLGRIWCLTRNGIVVLDDKGFRLPDFNYLQGENIPFSGSEPFFIFFDNQWRLWVGCQNGLFVLPSFNDSFQQVKVSGAFRQDGYTYIHQLSNNKILVSSLTTGMFEVKEKDGDLALQPLSALNDDSTGYTICFEDSGSRVIFSRGNMEFLVYKLRKDELTFKDKIEFNGFVNGIIQDKNSDKLWLATSEGLFRINPAESPLKIERDPVLKEKNLKGLLQDNKGHLWLSSSNGLFCYIPDSSRVRHFGPADGLQSEEFNFWSSLKTKEGLLAFGGVNGINLIDPDQAKDLEIKANPTITNILIDEMPAPADLKCQITRVANISQMKKIVLPFSKNTLSFTFAALEYSDPSSNEFQFQMEGVDDSLVYNGTNNFTRYPNLQPGDYSFRVLASNSDGVWSDDEAVLDIKINPPWYLTLWAKLLWLFSFLGLVYIIYRIRVGQIEFKRKEAEYKQLVAETETAVLRLQMNPHFIGNCVNSISSYILEKDVDTAYDYTSRLYKMMRLILEYAEKPKIFVSEEIELLEAYLKVQQIRFADKYVYALEVDENLDPDEVLIPTMILQPFVENSIKHGLANKKGSGKIDIRFWLDKEVLFCSVTDNGIGRKAAANLRRESVFSESKSIEITRERLELIKPINGVKASFEFFDLYEKDQQPKGTKVLLQFPLL